MSTGGECQAQEAMVVGRERGKRKLENHREAKEREQPLEQRGRISNIGKGKARERREGWE